MRYILLILVCLIVGCDKSDDIKSVEGLFVIEEIFMNDIINSGILSDLQIKDLRIKDKEIWDGINLAKKLSKVDPVASKKIIDSTKNNIELFSKEINQSK